jgi:hypothetical protein
VTCGTREDLDVPVEAIRDTYGQAVAARMCFTNDVDALVEGGAGAWKNAAVLTIASGRCMAADPTCLPGTSSRLDFEVAPGRWAVETFVTNDSEEAPDCLGLRIRLLTPGDR